MDIEKTYGHSRGKRGWDGLRAYYENMYITKCKIARGNLLKSVLWDNLEGWDGVGDGREF